jgi:hypothetical protein
LLSSPVLSGTQRLGCVLLLARIGLTSLQRFREAIMSDDIPENSARPAAGPVSRRGFLSRWLSRAALTATGVVSAMAVSKPAGAQGWGPGWGPGWDWGWGYVPKAAARYQDRPNRGRRCAGCRYFRAPHFCAVVEGLISPQGWCMYHDGRGRAPGPGAGGRAGAGPGGRAY